MTQTSPVVFKILMWAAVILAVRALLFVAPVMLYKMMNP